MPVALLPASAAPVTAPSAAPLAAPTKTAFSAFFALVKMPGERFLPALFAALFLVVARFLVAPPFLDVVSFWDFLAAAFLVPLFFAADLLAFFFADFFADFLVAIAPLCYRVKST